MYQFYYIPWPCVYQGQEKNFEKYDQNKNENENYNGDNYENSDYRKSGYYNGQEKVDFEMSENYVFINIACRICKQKLSFNSLLYKHIKLQQCITITKTPIVINKIDIPNIPQFFSKHKL